MSDEAGPKLRVIAEEVLGDLDEVVESTPLSRLFHRVWSVLPQPQEIVDVSPDDAVGDALAKMAEHDFSQLPVRVGNQVLGAFSYRSFARSAPEQVDSMPKTGLRDMPVDGFIDRPVFVSLYAEFGACQAG